MPSRSTRFRSPAWTRAWTTSRPVRDLVGAMAERKRVLGEVIHTARTTIQESRALVARAPGKPYLATRFGKPTIRDI